MNLLCALLNLHIYTRGTLKVWPILINSTDLIGQLIMYVFDIYSFHTSEFLQTYYHYIPLLLMKSLLCTVGSHFHTQWHLDYSYHGSTYEWWTHNILLHGCNMISGLGADIYFSPWLFGCLLFGPCHVFVSSNNKPDRARCLSLC